MNKAFFISLAIGGMVAGLTVKILNMNDIYLGFFPAFILFLVCFWTVRAILTSESKKKNNKEEQFKRSEEDFKSDTTQSTESESKDYSDSQPPPESPEPPESSEIPKEPPLSEEFSQKPRPWVRFWARTLDLFLLLIPTSFLFGLVFPEFTARVIKFAIASKEGGDMVILFILLPFTAVMEAFILAIFGNTPAKAILKTKITNAEGNDLSFVEAIKRSFYIYFAGYAMGIPIVNLITYAKAYNKLKKQGKTSWDKKGGFIVSHGHIGPVRTISFILLFIILNGFIGVLSSLDSLPKSSRTPKQTEITTSSMPRFSSVEEELNYLNSNANKAQNVELDFEDPFKVKSIAQKSEEPTSPAPKAIIKPPNEKVAKAQQQEYQQEAEQEKRKHLFNYYFKSGVNYYKDKKYYEAIGEFNTALSNQSSAEIYHYRGLAYYKSGKPQEAIKDLTKATEINPSYEHALAYRGHVYYENGQYEKAIEDYSRVIKINPSNKTAYYNRGINYLKIGQNNIALVDFKNACDLGDEDGCKELKAIRGY